MARRILFALLVSVMYVGLASATCPPYACPTNYFPVPSPTSCQYTCATAVKLNCLPTPTYDPKTGKWMPAAQPTTLQLLAAKPRVCGGISPVKCPAISCAYSSSYSISGPLGCSTASSWISATAVSSSTYDYQPAWKEIIAQYTSAYCATGYDPNTLSQYASAMASAYAVAVAKTIAHYNTYVCTCCLGNSAAFTEVKAALQAVATAAAQALAEAATAVLDCDGQPLSISSSISKALAISTELAIDNVYKPALSVAGYKCSSSGLQTQCSSAVAKATACVFAAAIAGAVNTNTPGLTYSCASSITITGGDWVQKCFAFDCPCTTKSYGYDNLGFETGSFDNDGNANPVWTATGTTSGTALVQSANIGVGTLTPAEGSYFAVIPTGCAANTLSTQIIVPPCATTVSIQWVFDCNDYLPFDDYGAITLTLTDGNGATVASGDVKSNCAGTGNYGVSNGGAWSTLTLSVPAAGLYTLTVSAVAVNVADCALTSNLYIDNVSFS